jgi:hypothetical protein
LAIRRPMTRLTIDSITAATFSPHAFFHSQ